MTVILLSAVIPVISGSRSADCFFLLICSHVSLLLLVPGGFSVGCWPLWISLWPIQDLLLSVRRSRAAWRAVFLNIVICDYHSLLPRYPDRAPLWRFKTLRVHLPSCGCAGSSLRGQASGCGGFSCCGAWTPGAGSATPRPVGSSQTRDWTHVPCVGSWILNHWATREVSLCEIVMPQLYYTCFCPYCGCFCPLCLSGFFFASLPPEPAFTPRGRCCSVGNAHPQAGSSASDTALLRVLTAL